MEPVQVLVTTTTGQDLHELDGGFEVIRQAARRLVDLESRPQILSLRCDSDRTVVRVTRPHAQAADGLKRGIGYRDAVGAERQRFQEIGFGAEATGDDERHAPRAAGVEVAARPGQRRDGGNRDVVLE